MSEPVTPSATPTAEIVRYFLHLGLTGFGGPVALVGQMERDLVTQRGWLTKDQMREAIAVCQSLPGPFAQYGWLSERDFLVAVAIGMISPGPVVITATFVGYLVAGFWGALTATVGIFLPSFILVLVAAPILARHRSNRNVQGFIKGAYAAAIGTILGACVLLGKIAVGDWLTALIAIASLVALFLWKVNNPLLMVITAAVGLIAVPLLHPTWILVK